MPIEVPRLSLATSQGRTTYRVLIDDLISEARPNSRSQLELWGMSIGMQMPRTRLIVDIEQEHGVLRPEIRFYPSAQDYIDLDARRRRG